MATVGTPFSIRETVRGEQVARSATCATLRLRRRRANFICSPTISIRCSNFLGSLVPIVFFAIIVTHHIICKYSAFCLLYDILARDLSLQRNSIHCFSFLFADQLYIYLCGLHVEVSRHLANCIDVCTCCNLEGCVAMSEAMESDMLQYLSFLKTVFQRVIYHTTAQPFEYFSCSYLSAKFK